MTEQNPRDEGTTPDWSAPEPGDEELARAAAADDAATAAEHRVSELFTPIDYAHAQPWLDFWAGDGESGGRETAANGEAFRQAADDANAAGDRLLASALEAIAELDGGDDELDVGDDE